MKLATERARILIGCYRTDNWADVEIAARAFVKLFMLYPEEAARAVSDPATGVPSQSKFPPSIAEVSDALKAYMAPIVRQRQRDAIDAAHRRQLSPPRPAQADKDRVQRALEGFINRNVVVG